MVNGQWAMGDEQRPIYADAKPIMAKQRAVALHTQRTSLKIQAFLTGIFHPHSYGGDGNETHSFPAALPSCCPRILDATPDYLNRLPASPRLLGVSGRAAPEPSSIKYLRACRLEMPVNIGPENGQAGNPRKHWAVR